MGIGDLSLGILTWFVASIISLWENPFNSPPLPFLTEPFYISHRGAIQRNSICQYLSRWLHVLYIYAHGVCYRHTVGISNKPLAKNMHNGEFLKKFIHQNWPKQD